MRRSAGPTENLENAEVELKAKENQSNNRISIIATMDNGTMVEAFKYLNYCQLAKNGLVSKRYRDLIRTHRNTLALLYVHFMNMGKGEICPLAIKIFDKKLSPGAYNEWVVRNSYSKRAPLEDQVAIFIKWLYAQYRQNSNRCYLSADAYYKDPSHRKLNDKTRVFFAQVEFNNENWPAFQHFIRLLTDPFVYIDQIKLYKQNVFLKALSRAVNPDRRLQCKWFRLNLKGSSPKSITWTKNNVRCDEFSIEGVYGADSKMDEALLDFFLTGAHCTSEFDVGQYDMSKTIVDFVQKFMDLKNSDECQLVEAIHGNFKLLTRDYAEFIVKEEKTLQVFEFINNDIGKKLTVTNRPLDMSDFSIKIINL
ncbi:hypothetical protein Ddc_13296 [Ditylenchus destructor]|nr:hypothetical protein Ddc_13296 [Ditylenchus destructor]